MRTNNEFKHMSNEEVLAIAQEVIKAIDNVNTFDDLDELLLDIGM